LLSASAAVCCLHCCCSATGCCSDITADLKLLGLLLAGGELLIGTVRAAVQAAHLSQQAVISSNMMQGTFPPIARQLQQPLCVCCAVLRPPAAAAAAVAVEPNRVGQSCQLLLHPVACWWSICQCVATSLAQHDCMVRGVAELVPAQAKEHR